MLTLRYLRRGPAVALVVLSLVVALLLHLALTLALAYHPAMQAKADELHAPDALVITPRLTETITVTGHGLTDVEVSDAQGLATEIPQGNETLSVLTVFLDRDEHPRLNQLRDVQTKEGSVEDPIWAPVILASDYALGDPITMRSGTVEHTFHTQGFIETFYGGATGTGGLFFQLPADVSVDGAQPLSVVKGNAHTVIEASKAFTAALGNHPVLWDQASDLMVSIATVGADVFAVVFAAFATLMAVAMLLVVTFLLGNLIRRDLAAVGALRAVGYTTTQVLGAFTVAFTLAAVAGALIGVALGQAFLPVVAEVLQSQSGLTWHPGWHAGAVMGAVLPIVGVVAVIALANAGRLTRVSTLDALQGDVGRGVPQTGLPLATTRGPLNVVLGIKSLLAQRGQQIALFITVLALTFATGFVLAVSSGLLGDADNAKLLLVGELEDVTVTVADQTQMDDVLATVKETEGVETAFRGSSVGQRINGRPSVIVSADDPSVWRTNIIVDGRFPKHANEIALGAALADRSDVTVGDTFHLDNGRHAADFVVTGIASSARNLGQLAMLTTAGEQHLNPDFEPNSVMVYAVPGHDLDDLATSLEARLTGHDVTVTNAQSSVEAQLVGFTAMGSVLSVVVSLISGVIVSAVLALITQTLISSNTKRFGIFKAVGFTTAQVTRQVVWTYLPTLALGAATAAAVAYVTTTPLLVSVLRSVGIVSVRIPMPAWIPIVVAAAVVLLGLVVVWLSALRLRRVHPTVLLAA